MQGKIIVYNNNRYLIKSVKDKLPRENQFTLNMGGEIAKIKQYLKEYSINIELQLIS